MKLREKLDAIQDSLNLSLLHGEKRARYLWARKRGFAPVIALVIAMVGLSIAVFIGLILNGNLYQVAQNYNLGAQGNATREALNVAINQSYSMTTIFPYIMIGTIALALVAGLAVGRGRGR